MLARPRIVGLMVCALAAFVAWPSAARGQGVLSSVFPEQRRMTIRAPSQLPRVRLPDVAAPPTVANRLQNEPFRLSLDEAIQIALENSEVVRVLTGAGATSSGSTIYDPAITNTQVDQARARFDPNLNVLNDFDRIETPQAVFDPPNSTNARITGDRIDRYTMGMGLSKTTASGGTASLNVVTDPLYTSADGLPLNPRAGCSVDMGFTQPLLQGGGIRANLAPIEIARIDTERSFYQLKQNVQQLVGGVIQAYWALVFARVDVWARHQQVEQGKWAFQRAEVQFQRGMGRATDRAQARSSLASFEANEVTARADLLRREAALRNILGLPPSDGREIVPVTDPATEWIDVEWEMILRIAEQYRPDLIELKLAIESDQQQLLLARNEAFPSVDASALYRWDALGGRAPSLGGAWLGSGPGQFTGWNLGIDVSVPLGLRQSRAVLRQRELTLMRDRANLEQALHNATHLLAENYRNLAQFYEQYEAFTKTREAARLNRDLQLKWFGAGLTDYLNVLEAITSWGNAIDSQAQSLLQYDTELANLEEQMGTILEAHGVRFIEEAYCSIGPMGRPGAGRWYPRDRRPGPIEEQYGSGAEPAEQVFGLKEPDIRRGVDRPLPPIPPRPDVPTGELIQPPLEFDELPKPSPILKTMPLPRPSIVPERIPPPKPEVP